jgi:hypothetical protein
MQQPHFQQECQWAWHVYQQVFRGQRECPAVKQAVLEWVFGEVSLLVRTLALLSLQSLVQRALWPLVDTFEEQMGDTMAVAAFVALVMSTMPTLLSAAASPVCLEDFLGD